MRKPMQNRRPAARIALAAFALPLLLGLFAAPAAADESAATDPKKTKMLVLGVDGLDPRLIEYHMEKGRLPNISRLIEQGDFSRLHTVMPPLSPIAWSTFITGMDPGGHGIFDFIHRDPATMLPEFSMAETIPPKHTIEMGTVVIPLTGATQINLRKGTAFWEMLEDEGVPTTVFRMPVNFPPVQTGGKAFSGMGTPDIQGTPGTFTFYTDRIPEGVEDVSGGKIELVRIDNNKVEAELRGPENPIRREERRGRWVHPDLTEEFQVYVDPTEAVVKIVVQDTEIVLKEGEWSDWFRVDFEAIPVLASASAIGRFYLQQVRPHFRLYVTPLQINPEDPAMPISTPESWSHELFEELGYFYTQELPEDTKAFSEGIFNGREFWQQAQFVYGERRNAMGYFVDEFKEGFTFFYFSSVDQGCHMIWHFADEEHPIHVPDELLRDGRRILYEEIDEAVGHAMASIDDDTTLIIMSDHGFAPFYRGVNLNSWLVDKGYATLKDPTTQGRHRVWSNVDWSKTKAYAVGLNGLYINLKGRERRGIVDPGEYQALLDQIERDLLEFKDPLTGENTVSLVVQTHRDFHGPHLDIGPDIIVGYNWGYRSSWVSPLGQFPRELVVDNDQAWSGDHAMDYRLVPGVLITNRKVSMEQPSLYDLTVGILDEYGIAKGPDMIGRDCLDEVRVEANAASDAELIGGGGYHGPEKAEVYETPGQGREPGKQD